MLDSDVIRTLGLLVGVTAFLVLLGRRFGVPAIVSSMLAGCLLGPVSGLIDPGGEAAASIPLLSEVGIVLLLFLVGLELSLDELRAVGGTAVVAALGQALGIGIPVFLLGRALGYETGASLVLAIALGLSSTVVVIKQLESRGELGAEFGRLSVGVLLVQDLIVVLVLTVLAGLSRAATSVEPVDGGGPAGAIGGGAMAGAIVQAFALMAILMLATLAGARLVLPAVFARVDRSPAASTVTALAWCFVLVEAAAIMGLSVEIGEFLAGLGLGGLPHRSDLRRRVKPLMGFFIAIFFAALGARLDPAGLVRGWPLALGLLVLVLVIRPPILYAMLRWRRVPRTTAIDTTVTLGQISEFSLILGAAAVATPGLMDAEASAAVDLLGVIALVTIVLSVLAMNGRARIHAVVGPARPAGATEPAASEPGPRSTDDDADGSDGGKAGGGGHGHGFDERGHVVVLGMNALGRDLVRSLSGRGVRVVAIDTDARKLAGLPGRGVIGDVDHAETRAEARLAEAGLAICALRIANANRLFVHRCRALGVPAVVHAFDRDLRPDLEALDPVRLLEPKVRGDAAVQAILAARGLLAAPDPGPGPGPEPEPGSARAGDGGDGAC